MKIAIALILCLSTLTGFGQNANNNLHLRVTPGADFAHLKIGNGPQSHHENFRIGGELEFTFPLDDPKWGILGEAAYQSYQQPDVAFHYESIEVSLGLRRHFYFSDTKSLFVNAMSLVDVPLRHTQLYSLGPYGTIVLKDNSIAGGFSFGAGVAIRRISFEGRYYTQREREATQLALPYRYGKASIILGIKLF